MKTDASSFILNGFFSVIITFQHVLWHSFSIILYNDNNSRIVLSRHNINLKKSAAFHFLKPMNDCIFYKGLKQQLINLPVVSLLVYIQAIGKCIIKAHLLQTDIFFQPVCQFSYGYNLVALIYTVSEYHSQISDHFTDFIFLFLNCHPVNGIKSIIQEMWINLGFQSTNFRILLILLCFCHFPPTIEGPKLYKRNGYYYIFAPAGGVKPGWQTVLRSKNIYGPWEEKIVLHQGNSPVNGPHQGAWVDTPDGQDWFLHFQDVGNAGRIVHLQPMHWENDWPVIGVNEVDGCGEPVLRYKKPEVGATYPIDAPEDSDFFEGENLGLQWQWNANYKKEWYDLENGQLILHAQAADPKTQLCDISNLLLQKWPAPEFSITTCLHLEQMKDGDVAGLVSLGGCYTALAVQKINGKMSLQQRTGNWTKDDEVRTGLGEWNSDVIYIQMKVEKEIYRTFYVGTAEENLQPVGQMVEATPGRWVGVKDGLFAINEQGMEGGLVAADYFVYQEL